jgi:predicted DNA-binding transcriptional regulator YafY
VDHIRQRLLIDSSWWWRDAETPPFWEDLQQAVYEDRVIQVVYERYQGDVVERVLEPYSLVNKSSYWYLVARRDEEFRTYRVARFHVVHLDGRHFARRPDFDLPRYWQEHLQEFVDSFTQYRCTLRVHPDRVAFVKWLTPGRWEKLEVGGDAEWTMLRLAMDSPLLAKMLVFGLGAFVEVIAPSELAEEVLADAREMVQRLAEHSQPDDL